MKKLLIACVFATAVSAAYAQTKIGLMVAPMSSTNRVKYDGDDLSAVKNGSALRFKFGLEFDFFIMDNAAFSTGLIYAPKRIGVKYTDSVDVISEEYKVQYLQLPATIKLYTSEVMPDMKVFFQLGFLGEIKLYSEPFDKDYVLIEKFNFYDFSFTGGLGLEYGAGVNTMIYGGVFYDRGLVNVVTQSLSTLEEKLYVRTSAISVKVGLKF